MPKPSTAGRKGENIRSDCWVSFEHRDSGGIEIVLNSRVESMYGDSIRELCREGLTIMGIQNAHLEVEDYGALPCTIMARIETAVRRAGLNPPEWLSEMKQHSEYTTSRDRFRRSRLYLPGNEPRFFINAGLHKPDCVILDLEDSVAPAEKDAARVLVRNTLRAVNFYGAERMVRINQGERGLEDLEWIVPHNVHVVLIPKVESAEQVKAVDEKINLVLSGVPPDSNTPPISPPGNRGGEKGSPSLRSKGDKEKSPPLRSRGGQRGGLQTNRPLLMPIIESALGGIKAYEIATASPNNVALAVGLEDYTADIGVQRTLKGRESFLMRSMIVNAARAAGIQPIDTVFSDVADMEGLHQSVVEAKSLGFDGKGCIHPRQIAVINRAFAPTEIEIEKARKIVTAFDKAEKEGLGVVSLGSKMIDPPVVKRALRTVEMAKALELIK